MANTIASFSRYFVIILASIYCIYCFIAFGQKNGKRNYIYVIQDVLIFLIQFISFMVIYLNNDSDFKYITFYILQAGLILATLIINNIVYKNASKLLINNMCFLLMVGLMYITRLSYDLAMRQFIIAVVALIFGMIVPKIIEKAGFLRRGGIVYGVLGFLVIASVFVIGKSEYGAVNWISLGPISLQPSELAKIIFVFFVAAMIYRRQDLKYLAIISAVAALYVIVLILEKDLGAALIFFVVYIVMLYVATKKVRYVGLGVVGMSGAAFVAYKLFAHVRTRVVAWLDPWSHYEMEGYQIGQSLFAISTGGWFGLGLCKGVPSLIPVVVSDFILSAISEEMGSLFVILLVLVYISSFVMFINISLKISDPFYKLLSVGLSTSYGFQIFLTIGGVIKMIPHTGVTLPLISYGGSSILSTIIIFYVIQGLYLLRQKEGGK